MHHLTRSARQGLNFLEGCRLAAPEVSLFAGLPGSGKTTVLQEFVREARERRPSSVLWSACVPGAGAVNLLQSLLDQVAPGYQAPGGRAALARLVSAVRRYDVRLIVLDDAQHLFKIPLEMVRALHQRARVAVVLAGPLEELRARLRQVPSLRALLGSVHTLQPMLSAEVDSVTCCQLGLSSLEPALSQALWEQTQGNWALLLHLLEQGRSLARSPRNAEGLLEALRQREVSDDRAA